MKKIEKVEFGTLKLLEKAASREMKVHGWDWPPACSAIFHQPKRPKSMKK